MTLAEAPEPKIFSIVQITVLPGSRQSAPCTSVQIVEFASKHPDLEITVEGYTDALGNYWYNQKLSQTRADAIKDYFVEQGIIPSRISARGLGPEDPIDSNETPEGRQRNRRVEIKLNL